VSDLVLAFDTSTEVTAVGLGRLRGDGGIETVAVSDLLAPRAALTRLLPAVRDLLSSAQAGIEDVGLVVVGLGPGSFTGVRIAMATAKGLSHGLGVALHGVGTLDAVAARCAAREGLIGVVGDAMRSEVYPALLRADGRRAVREPGYERDRVARPEAVAAEWAARVSEPVLLTGNGLRKYGDMFLAALGERATLAPEPQWAPSGDSLLAAATAARGARERGEADEASVALAVAWGHGEPATLLPVYTRLSDAEEAERGAPVTRPAQEDPTVSSTRDGESPPRSGVSGPDPDRGESS
jgi:bifunctional N6-L-threonylcarbamoyladenine synthase / protein kinase Bud32